MKGFVKNGVAISMLTQMPERSLCCGDQLLRYRGTDRRYGRCEAVYCNNDV